MITTYSGIPISRILNFSTLPLIQTKSRFLSTFEQCNFTPDYSNSPIFRTNFRFPWKSEKSGFLYTSYKAPSINSGKNDRPKLTSNSSFRTEIFSVFSAYHKNYYFLTCDWFKKSYFPLIRTVCYWTVCYRSVQ